MSRIKSILPTIDDNPLDTVSGGIDWTKSFSTAQATAERYADIGESKYGRTGEPRDRLADAAGYLLGKANRAVGYAGGFGYGLAKGVYETWGE